MCDDPDRSTSASRQRDNPAVASNRRLPRLSMWMDPTEDVRNASWARGFAEATRGFGLGTAFSNFVAPDEGDRLRVSYGEEKYQRWSS